MSGCQRNDTMPQKFTLTVKPVTMTLKIIVAGLVLALQQACTPDPDDLASDLVSQFQGGKCHYLTGDQIGTLGYPWLSVQPKCAPARFWTSWSTRQFAATCRVSAAVCMLNLPSPPATGLAAIAEFLKTGPNDINTGDGIYPQRGYIALA